MIKQIFKTIAIVIFCGLLFTACNEIVQPDLSKTTLTLLSPADNYQSSSITNTFYWEEVKAASKYQIQIAKPNFANMQQFMLDSNVTTTNFSYTLPAGSYQWRVKAINESSESAYSTRDIAISSSPDLNTQTLVLISPANSYATNKTNITFKWDTIYSADDYRIQIINSSLVTIADVAVQTDSFNYTLTENQYTWQVRAQNTSSNSLYTARSLVIDLTAPPVSTQLLAAGDSIFIPDTLFWSRNTAAFADSIFIYPDSLISPAVYKGYTTALYYIFTGTFNMDYYWRLKSVDAAGNWSNYSATKKFWIK